jgi:hypothetical protein
MRCVAFLHSSTTEFCAWANLPTNPRNLLLLSRCILSLPVLDHKLTILPLNFRERREHRVFRTLLNMVPGLEERLVQGTEEEVRMIADLVRAFILR